MTAIKATLQQLASALAEMQPATVSSSSVDNASQQQESRKNKEDSDSQQSTEEGAEAERPAATGATSESAPEASPAFLMMIASTLQQLTNMVSRMQTATVDEEQKEEISDAKEWPRPAQQREASPLPVQTCEYGPREHAPARDERHRRNE
ncbi:hypothetical protein PF008_g23325 [Phytophthora fragariae]|uniref:Uncharacterized protein n=1 Tax=Phytophthora fragariae TaxID=53985 RepID=A0A6G0QR51_9STRA|nr:hypothetical protein PF008_g23325 [Phytophthora fragariae]